MSRLPSTIVIVAGLGADAQLAPSNGAWIVAVAASRVMLRSATPPSSGRSPRGSRRTSTTRVVGAQHVARDRPRGGHALAARRMPTGDQRDERQRGEPHAPFRITRCDACAWPTRPSAARPPGRSGVPPRDGGSRRGSATPARSMLEATAPAQHHVTGSNRRPERLPLEIRGDPTSGAPAGSSMRAPILPRWRSCTGAGVSGRTAVRTACGAPTR